MVVSHLGDLILQLRHPRREPKRPRSGEIVGAHSITFPFASNRASNLPSAPSPQSPPSFACWPPSSSAPTPRALALVSLVSPSIYLLSNCANPTAIATNTPTTITSPSHPAVSNHSNHARITHLPPPPHHRMLHSTTLAGASQAQNYLTSIIFFFLCMQFLHQLIDYGMRYPKLLCEGPA